MTAKEREALLAAFDSGWVAPVGPELAAFEEDVAARLGVAAACALSSGTAALHLALLGLGVGPGDTVWLPTLTFAATANAVVHAGAEPVFLDVDPATWQLDPALLAEALETAAAEGALPAAVVPVDLYGQCADYDPILAACARYDLPVVADAAEGLGATYGDRAAGSLGRAAVLSFNGNKIVTTGGGGMLVSDDEAMIARARHLATQAREPALHYEHKDIGFNYRMSNLSAAIGRAQLRRLDAMVGRRRAHATAYKAALQFIPGLGFMPEAPYGRSTRWLTCITLDPAQVATTPAELCAQLDAQDIEARPVWKPMHLQPVHAGRRVIGGDVAAGLFATGVCLPSGSGMDDDQRHWVISAVRAALGMPTTTRRPPPGSRGRRGV